MDKRYILIKPKDTEKSAKLRVNFNRYVFIVHPDANKPEIKAAVEDLFDVKVKSVSVVRIRPRTKKRGVTVVHKKGYKKAYITLAKGESINMFEGA
ncbi:MAG: 50S ribosomal protein L23 [Desulfovibrio sp.]|nr:50S ribosomal protein L23 [Desulfovibrio sp.]